MVVTTSEATDMKEIEGPSDESFIVNLQQADLGLVFVRRARPILASSESH